MLGGILYRRYAIGEMDECFICQKSYHTKQLKCITFKNKTSYELMLYETRYN